MSTCHKILLTEDEYWENIEWIWKSQRQALNKEPITCRECERDYDIIHMFRCYFCGSYFCYKCGKGHFGEKPEVEIIKNATRTKTTS